MKEKDNAHKSDVPEWADGLPVFLTEQQLAATGLVSVPKLRRDRQEDRGLPYVKIGRLVKYPLHEVIRTVRANERNTGD